MEYMYIEQENIIKCGKCGKYTIGKVSVKLYYSMYRELMRNLCLDICIIFFIFVVASRTFLTLYCCKYYQSYHQHNVIWAN